MDQRASQRDALLLPAGQGRRPLVGTLGSLTLRGGNHGLTDDVPQAEGLAMDDRGSLYVVSEPNLFYR
ncbi:SdiA-regulated domain-containing protein, partial [Pseudomonas aeruginosa]|nr:SdiA-regulated domain-containing protein [Pseudomonas aeruginosa]